MLNLSSTTELILFSDDRTYVLQRPILTDFPEESVMLETRDDVVVTYFYIPQETSVFERKELHLKMIKDLLGDEGVDEYTIWTNRSRMISLIRHLNASSIIYDRESDSSSIHPQHLEEINQYAELRDEGIKKGPAMGPFRNADSLITDSPRVLFSLHHNPYKNSSSGSSVSGSPEQ